MIIVSGFWVQMEDEKILIKGRQQHAKTINKTSMETKTYCTVHVATCIVTVASNAHAIQVGVASNAHAIQVGVASNAHAIQVGVASNAHAIQVGMATTQVGAKILQSQ